MSYVMSFWPPPQERAQRVRPPDERRTTSASTDGLPPMDPVSGHVAVAQHGDVLIAVGVGAGPGPPATPLQGAGQART